MFQPNPWNPNEMGGFEYTKLLESMERWGFTDPVTVRRTPGGYEIIDGEHRWRAAGDLGMDVYYFDVGDISDDEAKALGLVLNELRGRHDPRKLGGLLGDLLSRSSPEEMLRGMPFTEDALKGLVGLKDFDWGNLDRQKAAGELSPLDANPSPKKGMRWVERTFRIPPDLNDVLQDALDRAKTEHSFEEDWQALEVIAAEYLNG
jgi:ParB-like chromosome segregation protein Spo0J